MRIIFVRHAIAEDRFLWTGSDASRPLTSQGKEKLEKLTKAIATLTTADKIISSNYLRAKETGETLQKALQIPLEIDRRLALGSSYNDFYSLFQENSSCESIILVGHEPDFSEVIAEIIGDGSALIQVKKASYIEVEVNENFTGELLNLITPKTILKLLETTH